MDNAPPYHDSSPCDDYEFIEEMNNEKAFEKEALYLFTSHKVVIVFMHSSQHDGCI